MVDLQHHGDEGGRGTPLWTAVQNPDGLDSSQQSPGFKGQAWSPPEEEVQARVWGAREGLEHREAQVWGFLTPTGISPACC